jgi:hypothetical protein
MVKNPLTKPFFYSKVASDTETIQSTTETIAITDAETKSSDCDVGIMVTSPGGTSACPEQHSTAKPLEESQSSVQTDGNKASIEDGKKGDDVEETSDKQDPSEFVNAQGDSFSNLHKP